MTAAILAQAESPVSPTAIGGDNCGGSINPDRVGFDLDPSGFFQIAAVNEDPSAAGRRV